MAPGLFPMTKDFGNGSMDQQYFQLDQERDCYLQQKRRIQPRRHGAISSTDVTSACQQLAIDWAWKTLTEEYPALAKHRTAGGVEEQWSMLSSLIQADIAVISAPPNDRIITTWISFPSGWAPERILGQSFWGLHGPVPTFANPKKTAMNLAHAMCSKGPFVRFVWTVCGDDILDHHPTTLRPHWTGHQGGYLRVERQVTVPLGSCAVFLIRTYLYPLDHLPNGQQRILGQSLSCMPESYARYKGLTVLNPVLARRLNPLNQCQDD
jgi:hypothetical protein